MFCNSFRSKASTAWDANPLWFSVHSTLLAGFTGDDPKEDKDTGSWIFTTFAT